jgi:hypothetical protein
MNKILKFPLLFAFICSFLCSCSDSNQEVNPTDPTTVWVPLRHPKRTDVPPFDSYFGSIDTIQLQLTDAESVVGKIWDLRCKDDTLFLCTRENIFLFNTKGEFLYNINRRGRGPGEYVYIEHFDINPKEREIVILEMNGLRKFIIYSFEGQFLRQIELPDIVNDFALLGNGDYLCYCPTYSGGRCKRGLWQLDPEGNFKKQLVELDDDYRYNIGLERYLVHINENQVGLIGSEDFDYFYQISADTVIKSYKMKTDIRFPDKYKKTNDYPDESSDVYCKFDYYETDSLLLFSLMRGIEDEVQVIYNKNSGKTTRYYQDEIDSYTRPDIKPRLITSYKSSLYYCFDAATVLNNDSYRLKFPNVTENSNPVLFVTH